MKNHNSEEKKLIHKQHNLLYFTTRDEKDLSHLDVSRLGTNLVHQTTGGDLREEHSSDCDSRQDTGVPKYIYMSCKPGKIFSAGYFDFCYHCILHQRKQDEIGQKITQKFLKLYILIHLYLAILILLKIFIPINIMYISA